MKFITLAEASEMVKVNPETIRRILKKGIIKKYSITGKILIDEEEFMAWLEKPKKRKGGFKKKIEKEEK